jgi:hypothetical protein
MLLQKLQQPNLQMQEVEKKNLNVSLHNCNFIHKYSSDLKSANTRLVHRSKKNAKQRKAKYRKSYSVRESKSDRDHAIA